MALKSINQFQIKIQAFDYWLVSHHVIDRIGIVLNLAAVGYVLWMLASWGWLGAARFVIHLVLYYLGGGPLNE